MARSGDECKCLTKSFQLDTASKASCVCKAGLLLLLDESDCVADLVYAERLETKFRCKQGLEYDSASASCIAQDWTKFVDYCAAEGRAVSLDGKSCDAACQDYQQNVSGRCTCVSHMAPDETGHCGCLSQNFEPDLREKGSCVCKYGLSLLPDESDCVQELEFATAEGGKFQCSKGLSYDSKTRACAPPSGKTWKDVAEVCVATGRVVSLSGTECVAQCGTLEIETENVCTCVAYAQKTAHATRCVCLTANFVQENSACVCRSGTLLDPTGTDCIETLRYGVAGEDAFACREGLHFVKGECVPETSRTWADLAQVCNNEGRIVSLAWKACVDKCPSYQREVSGRCVCGAGRSSLRTTRECASAGADTWSETAASAAATRTPPCSQTSPAARCGSRTRRKGTASSAARRASSSWTGPACRRRSSAGRS